MKKLIMAMAAASVATGVFAGAIAWGTNGAFVIDDQLGGLLATGSTVQLVKVVGTQDALLQNDPFDVNDFASWDDLVVATSQIGVGKPPPVPSWDGALQLNSNDSSTTVGDQYYFIAWSGDAEAVGSYFGVSEVFDIADNASTIDTTMTTTGFATSVEVIPEPATLGLMGIAGLGIFLGRKKTRS